MYKRVIYHFREAVYFIGLNVLCQEKKCYDVKYIRYTHNVAIEVYGKKQ